MFKISLCTSSRLADKWVYFAVCDRVVTGKPCWWTYIFRWWRLLVQAPKTRTLSINTVIIANLNFHIHQTKHDLRVININVMQIKFSAWNICVSSSSFLELAIIPSIVINFASIDFCISKVHLYLKKTKKKLLPKIHSKTTEEKKSQVWTRANRMCRLIALLTFLA